MKSDIKSYKRGDKIGFGKYRDKTFDHVCEFDPNYIQWMYDCRICDLATLRRLHRSDYRKSKISKGYAIVW